MGMNIWSSIVFFEAKKRKTQKTLTPLTFYADDTITPLTFYIIRLKYT
jgi:hypothetical protein